MPDPAGPLRSLPSVDEIVSRLGGRYPHRLAVAETRRVLSTIRATIQAGKDPGPRDILALVESAIGELDAPSLRPVINATGVVLHTNLGRAPLATEPLAGHYSNLEYDLDTGRRGKRDVHAGALLERLLGRSAIVVNNNAAALYLTLNELASGGEAIVSRGELIEIGDGFRIPDIMTRSGVILREIGTTNRTHIGDYRAAINERTRLIVRVHPSNFHITGFTAKPALNELAALASQHSIPLYEDLGSGCLVDLRAYGITEPLVSGSFDAGVHVVSFSCDKLLGGPQAGIIAGDAALVQRIRRNPMFRALRVDKLIYGALETTLRNILFERYDRVPALGMLIESAEHIRARSERFCAAMNDLTTHVVPGESLAGGGSTPDQPLPTYVIEISGDAVAYERKLRLGTPPVIARIVRDRLVVDLRTVFADEEELLASALQALS